MNSILIITASNGKNLELAQSIREKFDKGIQVELLELSSLDFPLFSNSAEDVHLSERQINAIKSVIKSPRFIFVSPEYNGSIPPVLSNFIVWVTQKAGDDWRKAFNSKFAGLASFSGNNGNLLMSSMLIMLNHLGVDVMGRKLISTYDNIYDESSIDEFCSRYKKQMAE